MVVRCYDDFTLFSKDAPLYTADPKKVPDAEFIPEIGAADLMAKGLDDLVIERSCLEIIQNSEVIDRVQIINGMVPGNNGARITLTDS
jgi:molybdenum storage protein